jgi:hypothetical protein
MNVFYYAIEEISDMAISPWMSHGMTPNISRAATDTAEGDHDYLRSITHSYMVESLELKNRAHKKGSQPSQTSMADSWRKYLFLKSGGKGKNPDNW